MGLSSGFRVLIVDDDPDMSEFLAHMLRAEGMDATTATDGEEGIAKVYAEAPDLVLLDVMMPGVTGFEVCSRLKSDEATAMVPIVLVTALDDSASRVRGIEAGADDFLSKPVRREELIARVKTLRRLHETRRELERRRLAAEVENREAIRRAYPAGVFALRLAASGRPHSRGRGVGRRAVFAPRPAHQCRRAVCRSARLHAHYRADRGRGRGRDAERVLQHPDRGRVPP